MKKNLTLTFVLVLCFGLLNAQENNSALTIGLGASANYYYGPANSNFDQFDNDMLNGQIDGMLGLALGSAKQGKRTLLAVFGSFGLNNRTTMRQIFDDQKYVTAALNQNKQNSFYHVEGGLLLGGLFRVSTGVGQQFFDDQTLISADGVQFDAGNLKYYSSTAGFYFDISTVAINVNVNFAYGKDFNKTVLTPSAGLMFRF